MADDGRTPVMIGAGQFTPADRAEPTSPLALMAEAARRALADAGAAAHRVDSIGVTNCLSWPVPDPGRFLAADLGAPAATTVTTHTSGTSPLDLLRWACTRIQGGDPAVTLLAGAEAVKALNEARYTGGPEDPDGAPPSLVLGTDRLPTHPAEEAAGLFQPVQVYPLFDNAIRAAEGRDVDTHVAWLGELWARFAAVAATNPHAWFTPSLARSSIVDISPRNRPVASPYPKLMTANLAVDQGAAVVVCSAATARRAGIPSDRWVYVHGTAAANDHWYVGEREWLHRSPAIRAIGRALLGHTGLDIAEIAHLDLYSCFPSAVQIAAAELGVDLRSVVPTVTGGLTFAGGPGSNYPMHALATLVERLRADRDGHGLCTGVGWFLTKHAAAVLTARPPANGYADFPVQSEVDKLPRRPVATDATGRATLETYTVTYDYDHAPLSGYVAALLPDGSRTFAATREPEHAAALLARDPLGAAVHLRDGARFELGEAD
jgi:acetyl-CoA C-acetyltransferase